MSDSPLALCSFFSGAEKTKSFVKENKDREENVETKLCDLRVKSKESEVEEDVKDSNSVDVNRFLSVNLLLLVVDDGRASSSSISGDSSSGGRSDDVVAVSERQRREKISLGKGEGG